MYTVLLRVVDPIIVLLGSPSTAIDLVDLLANAVLKHVLFTIRQWLVQVDQRNIAHHLPIELFPALSGKSN